MNILADSFPLTNAAGAGTMACPDACRFENQPQRQGSFRPSCCLPPAFAALQTRQHVPASPKEFPVLRPFCFGTLRVATMLCKCPLDAFDTFGRPWPRAHSTM
jgi:hypothetical protein